jgi:hypothetical protein
MKKGWYLRQKEEESRVEREIERVARRVDKAFASQKITYKELVIVLPLLIIGIFKDKHIESDIEKQKKFFEELEKVVYNTLQLAKQYKVRL